MGFNTFVAHAEPPVALGLAELAGESERLTVLAEPPTLTLSVSDVVTVFVNVDATPPVSVTDIAAFIDTGPVDLSDIFTQSVEVRGMVFCEGLDAVKTPGWVTADVWIVTPVLSETQTLTYTLRPRGALDEYDFGCYLYYSDDDGNHEVESLASINIIPHKAYLPAINHEYPERVVRVGGTTRILSWSGTQNMYWDDKCEDVQRQIDIGDASIEFKDERHGGYLNVPSSEAVWSEAFEWDKNFYFEQSMTYIELPPDWRDFDEFRIEIAPIYVGTLGEAEYNESWIIIAASDWDGELPSKSDWDTIYGELGRISAAEIPQQEGYSPKSKDEVVWVGVSVSKADLERYVRDNKLRFILYDKFVRDPNFCSMGETAGGFYLRLESPSVMYSDPDANAVVLTMK
jgi:hypothetical protein